MIQFFKIVHDALKKARQTYKDLMWEQKQKHKLLSSKSDWSLLEKYVQMCNANPDLNVTVALNDGTRIYMNCYKPKRITNDQLLNSITIEE